MKKEKFPQAEPERKKLTSIKVNFIVTGSKWEPVFSFREQTSQHLRVCHHVESFSLDMADTRESPTRRCTAWFFKIHSATDTSSPQKKFFADFNNLHVNARDRKYQIWERNPLRVPIWSDKVLRQKLGYIHNNPVRAGLCKHPEDHKYSSASFYYRRDQSWKFLIHCDG